MKLTPAELQVRIRAVATVLDYVHEDELAASFWGVVNTLQGLENEGMTFDSQAMDVVTALDHAVSEANLLTSRRLQIVRTGFLLTEAVAPYWSVLRETWRTRRTGFLAIWQPVAVLADEFAAAFGKGPGASDKPAGTVKVLPDPASIEFRDVLHTFANLDNQLRLMFINAEDPNLVHVAEVHDEVALDAMLSRYTQYHWRGLIPLPHDSVLDEYRTYVVAGRRIFRIPGYLAACDKGVLDVLVTGENLPRSATTTMNPSFTRTLMRMTFSARSCADANFRDHMVSLGGIAVSPQSWDVPLTWSRDKYQVMSSIKRKFGYPVSMYEIVDASCFLVPSYSCPESHAVRVLSASVLKTVPEGYRVVPPRTQDLAKTLHAATAKLQGEARLACERLASAYSISEHVVVVRTGEYIPGKTQNLQAMFPGVRVDLEPTKIYVVASDGCDQLVTEDALSAAGDCDCDDQAHCECEDAKPGDEEALGIAMGDPHLYTGLYTDSVVQAFRDAISNLGSKYEVHLFDQRPNTAAATITFNSKDQKAFGLPYPDLEIDLVTTDGVTLVNAKCGDKKATFHVTPGKHKTVKSNLSPALEAILLGIMHELNRIPNPKSGALLDDKNRNAVNKTLREQGFDGNKPFSTIGSAIASAVTVLHKHGLELDAVTSANEFKRPEGTKSIPLAVSGEDPFSPTQTDSSLFFQWGAFGDGNKVSVVAYIG